MKTSLTYGAYLALAGAFLVMAVFFGGLHDDPAKFGLAQGIGMIGGIGISVAFMIAGAREKRRLTPSDKKWGYGSAFVTTLLIGLFGTLFAMVFNYLYFFHINPSFSEIVFQSEMAKLEAQNIPASAMENAEPIIKMMTSSTMMVITGGIFGAIGNTVIALIVAAFCKNRPEVAPPPVI